MCGERPILLVEDNDGDADLAARAFQQSKDHRVRWCAPAME